MGCFRSGFYVCTLSFTLKYSLAGTRVSLMCVLSVALLFRRALSSATLLSSLLYPLSSLYPLPSTLYPLPLLHSSNHIAAGEYFLPGAAVGACTGLPEPSSARGIANEVMRGGRGGRGRGRGG